MLVVVSPAKKLDMTPTEGISATRPPDSPTRAPARPNSASAAPSAADAANSGAAPPAASRAMAASTAATLRLNPSSSTPVPRPTQCSAGPP